MKNKYIATASLFAALLAAGCSPSAYKNDVKSSSYAKDGINTQNASQEMAIDFNSYSYERKADLVAALKAQETAIKANIEQLSARIDKSTAAAKTANQPKLEQLRDQADQLKARISDIEKSNSTTWNNVKTESAKAYTALVDTVTQSRQWLSEKIAP